MVTIERTREQREKLGKRLVQEAVAGLEENSLLVQEDGGSPTSQPVRAFVANAASEIVAGLLNRERRLEVLRLTAGARMDGGANLLVDFPPTDKRISLRVYPNGQRAWAAKTDRACAETGRELRSPSDVIDLLDWLTQE